MKIKVKGWLTPDGYTGANTEHTGKAYKVDLELDLDTEAEAEPEKKEEEGEIRLDRRKTPQGDWRKGRRKDDLLDIDPDSTLSMQDLATRAE